MFASRFDIALYLSGFVTALLTSLFLTYAVRSRARRAKLFDPLGERKLHTSPVPRIGGIAIFLSVAVTIVALVAVAGPGLLRFDSHQLLAVLGGAFAIHLLGLWDDVRPMAPRWKFVGQVVVAVAVYAMGVHMTTLSLPFVGIVELGRAFGLLFTVIWFVGLTNAFNLIDGLDGLAAGAALFALTTMFLAASINGQVGAALLSIILAGTTLGFLVFNFHPATIFLGDSGSLFLGFMLAGVGMLSSQKSPAVIAVAIPLVSLGLPVVDTAIAICRRFLRGQPIFSADRGHIHHRLLAFGHSPRKVALLLYGVCALLALGGLLMVNAGEYLALVLVVVGLGVCVAVQRLRFYEFEEFARLVRKGVRQREVIGRGVRIREASVRLRQIRTLDEMFGLLADTFADDQFQRAEVRLRPSFIATPRARDLAPDRRLDDDAAVWTWNRAGGAQAAWWEIKLPLLTATGDRFGSMVLWQDGTAAETSLSHIHTIAEDLRREIERKLFSLWHRRSYAAAHLGALGRHGVPADARVRDTVVSADTAVLLSGDQAAPALGARHPVA